TIPTWKARTATRRRRSTSCSIPSRPRSASGSRAAPSSSCSRTCPSRPRRADVGGADQFRYDGRRAVVVGGATGMGAAAARLLAELGAEVVALDLQAIPYEVDRAVHVDLRSVASIDAALDEVGGPIDALFACAGIATDGVPLMQVNFIGH